MNQARQRCIFGVVLALLLVVCVPSCGGSAGTHSYSNGRSRSDFNAKTETKIMTLEIRPVMTSNNLRMQVHLTTGSTSWVLTDPKGDVRWEEEIVAPARWNKSREFEPIVGEWTLKMSLKSATGSYDVQWQASN